MGRIAGASTGHKLSEYIKLNDKKKKKKKYHKKEHPWNPTFNSDDLGRTDRAVRYDW